MNIIIHSSKTMRKTSLNNGQYQQPLLLNKALELDAHLKNLSVNEISRIMHVSDALAKKTKELITKWNINPENQINAIDAFIGDIYSGVQVSEWSEEDRLYSNENLFIVSGLYGVLRSLDSIFPYRLELGYRLINEPYTNLYKFWGNSIAKCFDLKNPIINLTSNEYSKVFMPYIKESVIITPTFYTINKQNTLPEFYAVHSKIARGALASWLITNRITNPEDIPNFNKLGYSLDEKLSTLNNPVFICKDFEGIGLSIRLK